jgi:tetratricopeptide (TPR) repeat protein
MNYFHLARLEMAGGRHDSAAREIESALALNSPLDALLHRTHSEIEMRRGRHAAALAAAQKAIIADPTDPGLKYHLGGVLQAMGDLDQAAEAAAEAVRFARTSSPSYYRRQAEIEARRGNPTAALAILDQALAATPNDPLIWLDVSTYRMALNDLAAADEAAATAGAALPASDKVQVLRRRALIASKRNDVAAAGAFLREALTIAPNDPLRRLDLAYQLLEEGDFEAASREAKEALELSATPPAALFVRAAVIEERRGRWEEARGYMQQAVAADPANASAWSRLANLLTRTGDLSGAQEAAEKAMIAASGDRQPHASELAPSA